MATGKRFGIFIIVPLIVLILTAAAAVYLRPMKPTKPAPVSLSSGDRVTVEWSDDGRRLVFAPRGDHRTGFIFYPGSKVHPEAYAVPMRDIAAHGYLVVIPRMPVNLAVFGWKEAGKITAEWPEIESWAIGGHSLGGVMAARYVKDHPKEFDGLVFWASYPAGSWDLSDRDLPVMSIYGTLDGLAGVDDVTASKPNLPPDTRWVELEGGNHAQFGDYGPQRGDLPAAITAERQQQQVVDATVALLMDMGS